MTDSKTPDWVGAVDRAIARLQSLHDYAGRPVWDSILRDELDAAHSQSLLSAYERGRKEGIEEAAKVIEKETEAPAQRNSKSMWVQDIGDRLATAIRQLLEVKG